MKKNIKKHYKNMQEIAVETFQKKKELKENMDLIDI